MRPSIPGRMRRGPNTRSHPACSSPRNPVASVSALFATYARSLKPRTKSSQLTHHICKQHDPYPKGFLQHLQCCMWRAIFPPQFPAYCGCPITIFHHQLAKLDAPQQFQDRTPRNCDEWAPSEGANIAAQGIEGSRDNCHC